MTDPLEARLAALMVAAQGGDTSAYQALLRGCMPVVVAACRRRRVPPDRVDDVVQEALITIHRARATYDPARPLLPWLRAIADRRAIDGLRLHGRHGGHEVHNPLAYEAEADAGAPPDAAVDHADQARVLSGAIATLPEGQRQAVQRLALGEQSLEQAAAETGRSKVALKVNLHRALKALRGRLAGSADDV